MREITYGRSPGEIEDDLRIEILDKFPDQTLEGLLELNQRELVARRYVLEEKRAKEEEVLEWQRIRRSFTSGRPFYNGSLY